MITRQHSLFTATSGKLWSYSDREKSWANANGNLVALTLGLSACFLDAEHLWRGKNRAARVGRGAAERHGRAGVHQRDAEERAATASGHRRRMAGRSETGGRHFRLFVGG